MGKKNRRGLSRGLALLNPKNLEREVHVYGYDFSWKAHMAIMLCSMIGIGAIGVLFQLQTAYLAVTLLIVIIILPVLVLTSYRRMYEQKRFSDVNTYMEQVLYSFQKDGKIISALRETQTVFEDGQMHECIGAAIEYLSIGQAETEKGVLREALDKIEIVYSCTKIHTVHKLMISNEAFGGDAARSITLLLNDLEGWKRRGYKLQAQKKQSHTDNVISIGAATALCAVALYVLDAMRGMYTQAGSEVTAIFDMPVIQISSLVFILFMFYVLAKSLRNLAANWLQPDNLHDDNYIINSYEAVINYEEAREKRRSLIFAAPFFVAAVPVLIFFKTWLGMVLLLVGAFMLMQHKTGYNLAKKDIDRELYIILPQWLMQIALLLQTNNVQVSISKSISGAPAVLKKELEALVERLAEAPESLKSYTDFCSKFDIPEAQSCMRMLHAISESGTGDSKVQINNLLLRVNEMQEQADKVHDESMAFKSRIIFSYPVIAATVKLLIDLTLGMFFMMGILGSMGGV